MPKFKQLLKQTTSRYIIIGLSVYIIELGVIVSAQQLGTGDTWAVALSFWIGLVVSFILQKLVTFRDSRMQRTVLLPQIVAVMCLVLFNFGFTIGMTQLLHGHIPAVVARTIALGITTLWNFYLYRTKIFTSNITKLID